MRICFVTSLNLATNPRIVKEIKLALAQGFHVQVICQRLYNWSYAFSEQEAASLKQLGVEVFQVDASRRNKGAWLHVQIMFQLFQWMYKVWKTTRIGRRLAGSKSALALLHAASRLTIQPMDWVIVHNPGAFELGVNLAQRFHSRLGVDVEDYHPGEQANMIYQEELRDLLKWTISQSSYVSFASEPILTRCLDDLKADKIQQTLLITNAFPVSEFPHPNALTAPSSSLQLVWFSQNVSYGRGLENFVRGIQRSNLPIELTIFGNLNPTFFEEVLADCDFVHVRKPVPQLELHAQIGLFDVGLAIEPGKDENNMLALSNKLLTYAQAGLFSIVSDTPGQKSFLDCHSSFGVLTSMDEASIINSLQFCLKQLPLIRSGKSSRFEMAKAFSWEKQSEQLISTWTSHPNA